MSDATDHHLHLAEGDELKIELALGIITGPVTRNGSSSREDGISGVNGDASHHHVHLAGGDELKMRLALGIAAGP